MNQKSTRGVQPHEVDAAADALLAERLRPTVERVRMKIGRGSPNTVGPMLETWFAALAPRLGVAPAGAAGQAVPPAVRQALDTVWAAALAAARELADAAVAQEREALATERSDVQASRDDIARQQTAMAERQAVLNEGMALAKGQLEEQAQRIAHLQGELERRNQELADSRTSLAGLVQERDAERRRFDDQQRSHVEERQRAEERAVAAERRLLEEIDRARQETKQARSALLDAQRQHQQTHEALQAGHDVLGRKYHGVELEIASLRERLASSEKREADLRQLLEEQKTATAAAVARLASRPPDVPPVRRRSRAEGAAAVQAKTRP